MSPQPPVPDRLYKYRAFSARTLDMLVKDSVYFASASTFNDPFDGKSIAINDLPSNDLSEVLRRLLLERMSHHHDDFALQVTKGKPVLTEFTLEHLARDAWESTLSNGRIIAALFRSPESDPNETLYARLLDSHVERQVQTELDRRYDKGVFSLAEDSCCPLMWSHYGEQHYGICIGYSLPDGAAINIGKVRYDRPRMVLLSDVFRMLHGGVEAERQVDAVTLLTKMESWGYEREWRAIGTIGEHPSPFQIEEVVFGQRCSATVKATVEAVLARRGRAVQLFQIAERQDGLGLVKLPLAALPVTEMILPNLLTPNPHGQ